MHTTIFLFTLLTKKLFFKARPEGLEPSTVGFGDLSSTN